MGCYQKVWPAGSQACPWPRWKVAARASGLASGLALAVRPAGSASPTGAPPATPVTLLWSVEPSDRVLAG